MTITITTDQDIKSLNIEFGDNGSGQVRTMSLNGNSTTSEISNNDIDLDSLRMGSFKPSDSYNNPDDTLKASDVVIPTNDPDEVNISESMMEEF